LVSALFRLGIYSQAVKPSNLLRQVSKSLVTRISGFGFSSIPPGNKFLGINSQAVKPSNLLKQVSKSLVTRISGFGFRAAWRAWFSGGFGNQNGRA
jgi:hypothetical protein